MITLDRLIANESVAELLRLYPFMGTYLSNAGLEVSASETRSLPEFLYGLDAELVEERALDSEQILTGAGEYIEQMLVFLGMDKRTEVAEVTILPGRDKQGNAENFSELTIRRGEIISIVGPTGSGKSRLLADIEWMAQADTPTARTVLVNGAVPDKKWRFSTSDKLVAQLSQNMNFVMDLSVEEFIQLHAESRLVEDVEGMTGKIIAQANALAGETFLPATPITSLSGGQSRALMIADTAILSRSPIVLIDEIENAGIDRKKALSLLLSEEKIVLIATHDPILALLANRRIVIRNGGIASVIETSTEERRILKRIEKLDQKLQGMRGALRAGESLENAAL